MTRSADEQPVRAHVVVHGHVQGVGFRAFAARIASSLDLLGGVRNLKDGRVELDVEGNKTVIEAFVQQLKIGPPAGRVTEIETEWSLAGGRYSTFSVWY
ncbi:MAG: Acylphosphatase [Candidatus Nitrospira kreftii]|uniref:acylphosphatase n=1 Tax=Candidatus Nitrospira kreftii TaxID=2652173 RepID=A0A7S8IZW7_9BACT|nr:MAG: Acylphosphatase [Candidatus Nitrospira kreftii]